jgi:putative SOS response-associated peptidase YedK
MCGRFGLIHPERLDWRKLGVGSPPTGLIPRYNIAPGSDVLVVRLRGGETRAEYLRWGLIPHCASDPAIANRLANARSDTAFEKPAFRTPVRSRRCLIPADVFYEWQKVPGASRRVPHAVRLKGGEPFALGGVWDYWRPGDGSEGLATCAILTTDANALLSSVHDRMPVIVPPERYAAWLDPRTPLPAVRDAMLPFPSEELEAWAVSNRVNDPGTDDPSVLEARLAT